MKRPEEGIAGEALYEGLALIADPIHGYITFTTPKGQKEKTEKDLIDSPWMQRLRNVCQLQSARWVYPSAEHSRFQHSLGTMYIAGRFARHLYPSLKESIEDCPSEAYIEELLRVAALLHDIGHGPFGHFFDDNFLEGLGLTHEILGQRIIVEELGELIKGIKRSPGGNFDKGEVLDPKEVSFLIRKDSHSRKKRAKWLTFLQPLLSGIYTVDNLDYVLRDSYMCGISIGPIDMERLMHYSFFTNKGLTLHRAGSSALTMFLNARLYLYSNVYYHRTTRAIDFHLREIFKETMRIIFPYNPVERLDKYLELTDWSLLEEVRRWRTSRDESKRTLFNEWEKILLRDVKWKMAFDTTLSLEGFEKGKVIISPKDLEEKVRKNLSRAIKNIEFRVDMASHDPRPLNPLVMGNRQIHIYNPSTRVISKEPLKDFFDYIPARVVKCRIFALNHKFDIELSRAAEKVLRSDEEPLRTNI